MGYSIDLFFDHVDEEFRCSICNDVLKDPTMTEGCEHIFCTSCIQTWMMSSATCPIDRTPVVGFRAPFRAFMNLLDRLRVKCGFEGCDAICTIGNIEVHYQSCDFNPETIKLCARNCGASIKMKEMSDHSCVEYLKQLVEYNKIEIDELKQELLAMKERKDAEIKELSHQIDQERQSCESAYALIRIKDKEVDQLKNKVTRGFKHSDDKRGPVIIFKTGELTLEGVRQFYINTEEQKHKLANFYELYSILSHTKAVVFCNSRPNVDSLVNSLHEKDIDAVAFLHAGMDQAERQAQVGKFRSGCSRLLITTDLLTQRVDVFQVSVVVHYDLPTNREDYILRIVSEGGLGHKMVSIAFATNSDEVSVNDIALFYRTQILEMPNNIIHYLAEL